MATTKHTVGFWYTHQELLALCQVASREDVNAGGRYGRGGGAIHSSPIRGLTRPPVTTPKR
jgi:hypothetical protein